MQTTGPKIASMLLTVGLLVSGCDSAKNTDDSNGSGTSSGGGNGPPPAKPGIGFLDIDTPVGLTPDGSMALLQDVGSGTGDVYFYDTAKDELTKKPDTGDFERPATAISSGGGRVAAFHGNPIQAGIWSEK